MQQFYPTSAPVCTAAARDMVACDGIAPSPVYARNSSCYRDMQECWPLNVRGLVFEVKRIGQSTPHVDLLGRHRRPARPEPENAASHGTWTSKFSVFYSIL